MLPIGCKNRVITLPNHENNPVIKINTGHLPNIQIEIPLYNPEKVIVAFKSFIGPA
jgi:hypothetical protein